MKVRLVLILSAVVAMCSFAYAQYTKQHVVKHRDYVPNEETAIKIAEAVWLPIYGEEIYELKPFYAYKSDSSTWVVRGSVPSQYKYGGVPYIFIKKYDGQILKVYHTK